MNECDSVTIKPNTTLFRREAQRADEVVKTAAIIAIVRTMSRRTEPEFLDIGGKGW